MDFELLDWNELTPDALGTSVNLVVSNPPYLTESEWSESMPEVKEHDPKSALAGENGLADIFSVIKISSTLLSNEGVFVMEIGAGQAGALETVIVKSHYTNFEFTKDLLGVRRFLWATKSSKFPWQRA